MAKKEKKQARFVAIELPSDQCPKEDCDGVIERLQSNYASLTYQCDRCHDHFILCVDEDE